MRVRPAARDSIRLTLAPAERSLLHTLTSDLLVLLEQRDSSLAPAEQDPAFARLLPDAYKQDEESAAEFRRFTEDELVAGKIADAHLIAGVLDSDAAIELNRESMPPWLRTLTSLRLTIATRLGIEADEDEGPDTPEAAPVKQVYFWLGYLQESLITAL